MVGVESTRFLTELLTESQISLDVLFSLVAPALLPSVLGFLRSPASLHTSHTSSLRFYCFLRFYSPKGHLFTGDVADE